MKFNIASLEQYFERRDDLKVLMILHDDFNRHESYILARRKSDNLVLTLVYVASDLSLDIVQHDSELTALCYLLEVAEHTFHMLDRNSSSETKNLVDLADMLRSRSAQYLS